MSTLKCLSILIFAEPFVKSPDVFMPAQQLPDVPQCAKLLGSSKEVMGLTEQCLQIIKSPLGHTVFLLFSSFRPLASLHYQKIQRKTHTTFITENCQAAQSFPCYSRLCSGLWRYLYVIVWCEQAHTPVLGIRTEFLNKQQAVSGLPVAPSLIWT